MTGPLHAYHALLNAAACEMETPTKSAKKREQQALQVLGEQLITLPERTLDGMPLNDELREAVMLARRIKSHSALRRQRQLIGKLMRSADVDPIREALARIDQRHRSNTRTLHDAEQWRERLLSGGQAALDEFLAMTGRTNTGLAALIGSLPGDAAETADRRTRREIFRLVHADLAAMMQNSSG
ncbi:MAG: ribosome biogenesis factor YjgA [Woeseiaceae bacterium]|nr:ribosome biogenesis factor YjgA [Woeseiaceae bacterium]